MCECLIVVDVQNDFLPGGALAVPHGDEVIPEINRLCSQFGRVVATQDWHPSTHGSFAANHPGSQPGEVIDLNGMAQVLWPVHCVQQSKGADFSSQLILPVDTIVFQKGTDPKVDSYSGFFDNGKQKSTGLGDFLKEAGVQSVTVVGLATDYCVKYTALDALDLGFDVRVVRAATRAVNLNSADGERALKEMEARGVSVL